MASRKWFTEEELLAGARAACAELGRPVSTRELAERLGRSQSGVLGAIYRAYADSALVLAKLVVVQKRPDEPALRYRQRISAGRRPNMSPRVMRGLEILLATTHDTAETREARAYIAALMSWYQRRRRARVPVRRAA
jgi:hypothetical protein